MLTEALALLEGDEHHSYKQMATGYCAVTFSFLHGASCISPQELYALH